MGYRLEAMSVPRGFWAISSSYFALSFSLRFGQHEIGKPSTSDLQYLDAVIYEAWRRVKHQWTTIAGIALGLLFLLWFCGLVSFLLGLLLGRDGHVLYSLDSRVDGIFDCVRHAVVAVESEARGAGVMVVVSQTLRKVV